MTEGKLCKQSGTSPIDAAHDMYGVFLARKANDARSRIRSHLYGRSSAPIMAIWTEHHGNPPLRCCTAGQFMILSVDEMKGCLEKLAAIEVGSEISQEPRVGDFTCRCSPAT